MEQSSKGNTDSLSTNQLLTNPEVFPQTKHPEGTWNCSSFWVTRIFCLQIRDLKVQINILAPCRPLWEAAENNISVQNLPHYISWYKHPSVNVCICLATASRKLFPWIFLCKSSGRKSFELSVHARSNTRKKRLWYWEHQAHLQCFKPW